MTPEALIIANKHKLTGTQKLHPGYVNPYGLPMPLCKAIEWQNKAHSRGRANISVTSLIDAPLQFFLRRVLMDHVVLEYSDRLWALYGTLAHEVLEKGSDAPGQLRELRMFADLYGWCVSGQMDLYEDPDVMTDYKFTSTYTVVNGLRKEWENQENTYATLMRHSDDPAVQEVADRLQRLQICAMLRDWGPRHANKIPSKVKILEVPIWPAERADDYVATRIGIHKEVEDLAIARPDFIPPMCSPDERWLDPPTFAVKKKGNKKAKKLCETLGEADAYINLQATPNQFIVEERAGGSKKCETYCDFSRCGLCPYYKCKKPHPAIRPIVSALPVKTHMLTVE